MRISKIRNSRYTLLIILLIVITTLSCTHNNGDIGELFGSWYLESIEIDGVDSSSYEGDIFFAFQNSVTTMTQVDDYNTTTTIYGDWSRSDTILYLTYSDTDYQPLPVTGFVAGVNECDIIELNSETIILEYTTSDSQIYRYIFSKR